MKDTSEGNVYAGLIALLGVLFLACAIYLSIYMISAIVGPFDFGARRVVHPPGYGLGLWLPTASRGDEPDPSASAWRDVLAESWEVAQSDSLASLVDRPVRVIIAPRAAALAPEDRETLERFVAAGGAVVVTGEVGFTSHGEEEVTQPGALLDLEDAEALSCVAVGHLAPRRPGPLLAGVGPDAEVPVLASDPIERCACLALSDDDAELCWSGAGGGRAGGRAASQRRALGRGRWVWLAVGPECTGEPDREPWRPGVRIYRNAIAWATGQPAAMILPQLSGDRPLGTLHPSDGERWRTGFSELRARVRVVSERRIQLDVSNLGSKRVEGVIVRVYLNRPLPVYELGVTALGQSQPRTRLHPGAQVLDLHFESIRARGHQTFTVDSPEAVWKTHLSALR